MKILIIQTSFPGDVILAAALPETLRRCFPEAELHFLVRKGNESLMQGHPFLHKVWIWDKKRKWSSALELIRAFRREKFSRVVNVQRFFMTGLMTVLSGAPDRRGFDKNPLSFMYTKKVPHVFQEGLHEVQRNHLLIADICGPEPERPRLYPPAMPLPAERPYIVLAPASVWFTKQWPEEYWSQLAGLIHPDLDIVLSGGPADHALCERIEKATKRPLINTCGKYSLLQSAGIIQGAAALVCNDSAPAHLATAVNTPTVQIYCSTDTRFGFSALASRRIILETPEPLSCRPCTTHGREACPLGHFLCGKNVTPAFVAKAVTQLLNT